MNVSRLEILLATYNGEAFLPQMLESLLAQSFDDFHLLISDDLSTDGTRAILDSYAPRFRNPVRFLRNETGSGSAFGNFRRLIAAADADCVMFADQDDIWLPDKVERARAALAGAERRSGGREPVLYHSDLTVIDAGGAVTHPSFWAMKSIVPEAGTRLETAALHATVVGCTMAINRPLLDRVRSIPQAAVMHDWWIGLVAATFGTVVPDPRPSVLYRRHGGNASVDGTTLGKAAAYALRHPVRATRRASALMRRRIGQALALAEAFPDDLPAEARRRLDLAARALDAGRLRRPAMLRRSGLQFPSRWKTAVLLLTA